MVICYDAGIYCFIFFVLALFYCQLQLNRRNNKSIRHILLSDKLDLKNDKCVWIVVVHWVIYHVYIQGAQMKM